MGQILPGQAKFIPQGRKHWCSLTPLEILMPGQRRACSSVVSFLRTHSQWLAIPKSHWARRTQEQWYHDLWTLGAASLLVMGSRETLTWKRYCPSGTFISMYPESVSLDRWSESPKVGVLAFCFLVGSSRNGSQKLVPYSVGWES